MLISNNLFITFNFCSINYKLKPGSVLSIFRNCKPFLFWRTRS